MCGEQHGDAVGNTLAYETSDQIKMLTVEPLLGFVKDEEIARPGENGSYGEQLRLTRRQFVREPAPEAAETKAVEDFASLALSSRSRATPG